ncbi:MAG: hypothetical protein PSX81_10125 [bacterium]|nr:hypothetical protein [bacterium]
MALICIAMPVNAQKKEIRLNFGLQGNLPERYFNTNIQKYNGKNGGMGFHVCPQFIYNKHLAFNLNIEYSFVIENYQTDAIGGFDIISIAPGVNYYFTEHKIRPFVGLGAGIYHVIYHEPKVNLGVRPLLGVSFNNRFALSIEYNRILANIKVDPHVRGSFDNYYLAVKGSFSLGIGGSGKK